MVLLIAFDTIKRAVLPDRTLNDITDITFTVIIIMTNVRIPNRRVPEFERNGEEPPSVNILACSTFVKRISVVLQTLATQPWPVVTCRVGENPVLR